MAYQVKPGQPARNQAYRTLASWTIRRRPQRRCLRQTGRVDSRSRQGGTTGSADPALGHGAEHMVVTSYRETGESSIEAARQFAPRQGTCGGRYAAPYMALVLLTLPVHAIFKRKLWWAISLLIGAKGLLWVDHLWGFDKVPGLVPFTPRIPEAC